VTRLQEAKVSYESAREAHRAGWHEGEAPYFTGVCRDCTPVPESQDWLPTPETQDSTPTPEVKFWSSRKGESVSLTSILLGRTALPRRTG